MCRDISELCFRSALSILQELKAALSGVVAGPITWVWQIFCSVCTKTLSSKSDLETQAVGCTRTVQPRRRATAGAGRVPASAGSQGSCLSTPPAASRPLCVHFFSVHPESHDGRNGYWNAMPSVRLKLSRVNYQTELHRGLLMSSSLRHAMVSTRAA